MHEGRVVPDEEIALPPDMPVDPLVRNRMSVKEIQQFMALGCGFAFDTRYAKLIEVQ